MENYGIKDAISAVVCEVAGMQRCTDVVCACSLITNACNKGK